MLELILTSSVMSRYLGIHFCKQLESLLKQRIFIYQESILCNFPGGPVLKNLPADVGDTGSISGWGTPSCLGATKLMSHN